MGKFESMLGVSTMVFFIVSVVTVRTIAQDTPAAVPERVVVSIDPQFAAIATEGTQQFKVNVRGASNDAVIWRTGRISGPEHQEEVIMRRYHATSCFLFFSVVLMALSFSVHAQVANTGVVLGTVTDPSGAVAPDVAVTLRNTGTNTSFKAQTNQSGEYRFLTVPPGQYELTAEKSGFSKTVYPGFEVHAAEPARVDLVLKVGSFSQEVTVTGEIPTAVNTVTANEGNTITGQQVNSLPLTNRVFTQLMSLEPGVSQPVMNDVSPGFGSNSFVDFSVNGVRDDENNLLIDGVRNVDTFGGNAFVAPNLFAVSEVRIENNDYTATAGRSAGAQVNLVSRPGTNQFHGDVFEFFRNDFLNAYNRFSLSKPENRYNDFGYDVGGPIIKDRLFFFWSQEWRRILASNGPVQALTPTQAERNGDFSASPIQPIDPNTGGPFPSNRIPNNRIDSNAQLLLQTYFPLPIPGYNSNGFNYVSEAPNYTRWRKESLRMDYRINGQ